MEAKLYTGEMDNNMKKCCIIQDENKKQIMASSTGRTWYGEVYRYNEREADDIVRYNFIQNEEWQMMT